MQLRIPLMTMVMAFGVGCSEIPPEEVPDDPHATVITAAPQPEVGFERPIAAEPRAEAGAQEEQVTLD